MADLNLGRTTFGSPENVGNVLTREEATNLLNDWIKNERLRLHCKQVAYLMRQWCIEKMNANEEESWKWELAGLLHDADWDQWPDMHCRLIIEELERRNIDAEIIQAIASHGWKYFGVKPQTDMDKMLYALDELSGFVHAYSLMRPEGYNGMEIKGVKKRLKEKSFAANVSREDIDEACNIAGIALDDLIAFIISHQPQVF